MVSFITIFTLPSSVRTLSVTTVNWQYSVATSRLVELGQLLFVLVPIDNGVFQSDMEKVITCMILKIYCWYNFNTT